MTNPKDLFYYLQGKYRYWLLHKTKYGRRFVSDEVKFYIDVRYKLAKKECLDNAACVVCGCDMPELLYCNKACKGGCYPAMGDYDGWIKKFDELQPIKKR